MSNSSLDEIIKARDRLVAKLKKRANRPVVVSPEERQAQLATAVARLQAASISKDQAIQYYDDEIRRYTDLISQLESEIVSDQSQAALPDAPKRRRG